VALLTILHNLFCDDLVLETPFSLIREVKVLEAGFRLGGVIPGDTEMGHQLFGEAQTSTRVRGKVDARDAHLSCKLSALEKEGVLLGAKRADSESDVVGDNDELATVGVFRRASIDEPSNHAS